MCLFLVSPAQTRKIDSVLVLLKKAKEDSNRVDNLTYLANQYILRKDYDKAALHLAEARVLSQKLGYLRGMALYYRSSARSARSRNELDQAIAFFDSSLTIFEKLKRPAGVADICGSLGNLYYDKGIYDKSISCFLKAIKVYEDEGDKRNVSGYSGNLGAIYESIKDYNKALDFYNKALKVNREIGYQQGIAINLVCIGNVYMDKMDNARALEYDLEALKINESLGDSSYTSNNLHNISVAYSNLGNYRKALEYELRARQLSPKDDMQQYLTNLNGIGTIYVKLKEYRKAEKIFLEEEKALANYNSLKLRDENARSLSVIYDSLHDYRRSLSYYRQHIELRDSIYNDENRRRILDNQLQFEYQKKATADSIRVAEEEKVVAVRLEQERTQRFALYGGLALVALFAGFMFNRFRITNRQKKIIEQQEKETKHQKYIIEEKHKAITDSINYAERIQRSFLASKEMLDEHLQEYFVFFKPKDVVSGDFYWAGLLNNGLFALVTADSTGHGVPGAIMSLLNITSIEASVKKGCVRPADILNETRQTIITRLKNDGSAEGGKDGMDCSICVYDFNAMKLYIAAANNPVWIIRGEKVIEIKPDKMPVGKHDKLDMPFTQQEIEFQKGDVVYTLTDGFADQFGGVDGKKFMSKRLRQFLAANAQLPMSEQRELLEHKFVEWVGGLEQVDDVCVIGIRL